MARTETLTVGGSPMRMFVAEPSGSGPHPAIVVMCHIGGLDTFTADRCDRLAAEGFAAAAPDIFHYHPWSDDRNERRATLRDATMVADIEAAAGYFDATGKVDGNRLGILGHCLGGRTALLGAGSVPRLKALAMYYGGRTMVPWGEGPSPFDRIADINGPVIGFFGDRDQEPSPKDVDKIEAEMRRHGLTVEFHRYADAGHAFQDYTAPERHCKGPADDAWVRTLAFFTKVLKSP